MTGVLTEDSDQTGDDRPLGSGFVLELQTNEDARVQKLLWYDILDSGRDERFDRIARLASASLNVPMAFITFIESERVWFKSSIGVDLNQCDREGSFCGQTILDTMPLMVPDALQDTRFQNNPFVAGDAGIRFYAGAPLRTSDGFNVGTICAFDVKPRELSEQELGILIDLAAVVVDELELRQNARKALEATSERFHDVASHAPGVVFQFKIDAEGERSYPYVSPMMEQIFGLDPEEVMQDAQLWLSMVHPDDAQSLEDSIVQSYTTLEQWKWEGRAAGDWDKIRWFRGVSTPRAQEDGSVLWTGLILDVTEEKNRELRLQQAQRLEAVGQLTGGVAHDFNNLLAVIQGNADLLTDQLGKDNSLLQAIVRSSRRGAQLTQQLLSFSRRQSLQPSAVDLTSLIDDFAALLLRTLGENIDVNVQCPPDTWFAFADAAQLESALLNLCLNARDAMREGGNLHIVLRNVILTDADLVENSPAKPGEYVEIGIRDDGLGMNPTILDQAFEPFFSTKEVGQGSGLGLSMVYGFAQQSNGQVTIHSREGEGTEVRMYLPRTTNPTEDGQAAHESLVPMGQGQRILLIEDNEDMRKVAERMILDLGYQVQSAPDAPHAGQLLKENEFHLVLSDVILPGGINGPTFAASIRETRPNLPVLFMSGYSADIVQQQDRNDGTEMKILAKPFDKALLAQSLDEALRS